MIFLSSITLTLFFFQQPASQAAVNDTPLKTVQQFKITLDNSDLAGLCLFMAEDDGSGPLKRLHYESMQRSLENLVTMWRGQRFVFGAVEMRTTKQQQRATVNVEVPSLSQQIQFTLLKFGNAWYIFDMEIYFR
jgi:hypothetical protein